MPLYFAYGANMDRDAMAERCPASRVLAPGRLDNHRFIIAADGYASVVPAPGAAVHGLVWDLAAADIPALDDYEEVSAGLYRQATAPVTLGARTVDALLYLARTDEPGVPRPGYLERIIAIATDLPDAYRDKLRAWLPGDR